MSRLRFGGKEAILAETANLKERALTPQGFAELQEQGYAEPQDTQAAFQARIAAFEQQANRTANFYDQITLKYAPLVNKETQQRIYPDDVLEKMAYTASKIQDYDIRIPATSLDLVSKGVNVQEILDNIYNGDSIKEAGVKEALATINNLNTISEVKDNLKTALQDTIEMALRRKQFMKDYDNIKANPSRKQLRKTT